MDDIHGQPKTIDDLNLVIEQRKEKEVSVFGYIVLSLTLPPFTTVWFIYRTWKKGVLHRFLPTMTIVYTILFALYSWLLLSSPGAVSSVLGKNLLKQPAVPGGQNTIFVIMTVVLTIAGIVEGFYLRNKVTRAGSLPTVMIFALIFILILQFWVGLSEFSFVSSVINPSLENRFP